MAVITARGILWECTGKCKSKRSFSLSVGSFPLLLASPLAVITAGWILLAILRGNSSYSYSYCVCHSGSTLLSPGWLWGICLAVVTGKWATVLGISTPYLGSIKQTLADSITLLLITGSLLKLFPIMHLFVFKLDEAFPKTSTWREVDDQSKM